MLDFQMHFLTSIFVYKNRVSIKQWIEQIMKTVSKNET